jgi:serine/threonine protein kinase/tetratricopeptide (TPR) repeat protein
MGIEPSERHPIDALAEEFVARYRRGERPSVSEYAARYPELADQIQDVLQALVLMEELAPGKSAPPGRSPAPGPAPQRLGEYRIVRELGRGGMGVVYEAEQESLGRRVALKVLPFHALMDPLHLERFRREAKAAARLHHTNIVPVFGVGEEAGVHYYAMQFIDGQGLDQVLREVRELRAGKAPAGAGEPAAAVTRAERSGITALSETPSEYFRGVARLGVQVAEALAHAHAQGILHRDVKPSNLLLDAAGTIWVTDFGLAKAEGLDDLTHTGDLVGTLRYMAPERLEGWADPRSDVYSLGLTLYELLTLQPAFDAPERKWLIQQVTEGEPTRPRRLDNRIPRDLETVVWKAIAREPAQRYRTAAELAEDLRRFLDDKPIRARPPSLWERSRKWARRHRAVVWATAVLLVAGVVGLVVSLVLITGERTAARQEAARARLAAAKAEQINTFLQQMLASANPRQGGRHDLTVREVLDLASNRMEAELGDQPLVQAVLHDTIGLAYTNLGQFAAAERHHRAALTLRRPLLDAHDPDLAASLWHLGDVLFASAKRDSAELQEAIELLREAADIRRATLGEQHATTINTLARLSQAEHFAAGAGGAVQTLEEVGQVMRQPALQADIVTQKLGEIRRLWAAGRCEEAYTFMRASLKPFEKQFDKDDTIPRALRMLAGQQLAADDYDTAEPLFRQAVLLYWEKHPERTLDLAYCLNDLGRTLFYRGRYAAAEPVLRECLALERGLLGEGHGDFVETWYTLGKVLYQLDDNAGAEGVFRQVLDRQRRQFGDRSEEVALTGFWLGKALLDQYQFAEAEKVLREAVAIRRRPPLNETGKLCPCLSELAHALAGQERGREAEPLVREVLHLRQAMKSSHPDLLAAAQEHVAWFLVAQVEPPFAEAAEAVLLAKAAVAQAPRKGEYWNTLGMAHYRTGAYPEALTALNKAAELRTQQLTLNRLCLALTRARLGHHAEARRFYDLAVQAIAKRKSSHPDVLRLRREADAVFQ